MSIADELEELSSKIDSLADDAREMEDRVEKLEERNDELESQNSSRSISVDDAADGLLYNYLGSVSVGEATHLKERLIEILVKEFNVSLGAI